MSITVTSVAPAVNSTPALDAGLINGGSAVSPSASRIGDQHRGSSHAFELLSKLSPRTLAVDVPRQLRCEHKFADRLSELRRARHSASVKLLEGTTKAAISSPSRHLVKPTTATSFTPTCSARTVSTSEGCTLETPRIIRSDARPRRHRNPAHQVRRRLPDRPNRP